MGLAGVGMGLAGPRPGGTRGGRILRFAEAESDFGICISATGSNTAEPGKGLAVLSPQSGTRPAPISDIVPAAAVAESNFGSKQDRISALFAQHGWPRRGGWPYSCLSSAYSCLQIFPNWGLAGYRSAGSIRPARCGLKPC